MKQVKYFRKRNIIRGPEGDEQFSSVNKAKKRSREIRQAEGGLGCGVLQVVDKLPTGEV